MIHLKNIRASLCIGIVAALTISTASAHGAWLAQRWDKLAILVKAGKIINMIQNKFMTLRLIHLTTRKQKQS